MIVRFPSRLMPPLTIGRLRHVAVLKGVSAVVLLSIATAALHSAIALPALCVAAGALLSYLASALLFNLSTD